VRILGAALLAAVCSCGPRPVPPPVDAAGGTCRAGTTAAPGAVCLNMFTQDGRACAACSGDRGCVHATLQVYCSNGGCLSDPACSYRSSAPSHN
jgi:hypothetical protein